MDPSMMQGAPPMGGPPMDPSMDPAAQQGGAPAEPDIMEQLLGAMEEMAAAIEQNGADIEALTQGAAEAESQRQQLEKKLSSIASTAPVGADWS